jgi:ssDNA-binding Zn-finger/Zn-ribbon topoisomerase 1
MAVEKQTKAPPRFSESSLLGAMENAGRKLEDAALKSAMMETGLGTPATRAGIIETLIRRNFVQRKKKQLTATATGVALIESLGVELLKSASLTAEWESKFTAIEHGALSYSDFMTEVKQMASELVMEIKNSTIKSFAETAAADTNALRCPKCRAAGDRSGVLILRTSKKGGKFMVCSLERDVCDFLTDAPANKEQRAALEKGKCSTCGGAVKLRLPKEKGEDAWFPCIKYPLCKGSYKPAIRRPVQPGRARCSNENYKGTNR